MIHRPGEAPQKPRSQLTSQVGNFGPDHIRSINPFLLATFDAFPSTNISFFMMFTKDMCRPVSDTSPQVKSAASTTSTEDSGQPQQYRPTSSTAVLLSPLISSVGFLSLVGFSSSKEFKSPLLFFPLCRLPHHFWEAEQHVLLAARAFFLRCIKPFPSPAHFDIGVSHCTPLL